MSIRSLAVAVVVSVAWTHAAAAQQATGTTAPAAQYSAKPGLPLPPLSRPNSLRSRRSLPSTASRSS